MNVRMNRAAGALATAVVFGLYVIPVVLFWALIPIAVLVELGFLVKAIVGIL